MPIIPTFENTVPVPTAPGPPRADPSAFAAPGLALARAGAGVESVGMEWTNRYAEARRQATAADLVVGAAKSANDIYDQARIIPDRAQALQTFNDQFDTLAKTTLGGISDPLTQAHVSERLGEQRMILQKQVDQESFHREASTRAAKIDQDSIDLGNQVAANRDPLYRASILDTLNGNLKGAAAAGWITPENAQQRFQQFRLRVSQDDAMRDMAEAPAQTYAALHDPAVRAQKYPYLTPEWADYFALRHEGQARSAQARTTVDSVYPLPQPVPSDMQPLVDQAVSGTGVPAQLVSALVQHESSWNPNAVSPTGAIGLGQVLASTARMPGMGVAPVDPASLRDPATNLGFTAQYLAGLGRKMGVTDWHDPDQVAPVLQAYNGEPDKAKYAETVLHLAGMRTANAPEFPDVDKLSDQVMQRTGGDPVAQQYALAELHRRVSLYRSMTAADRGKLDRALGDTRAALDNGVDAEIPVTRIRALLPPQQADDVVQDLAVRSAVGQVVRSVQFASPDELQQTTQALATGTGRAATMLNLRLAKAGLPPLSAGDEAPETANFKVRRAALGLLQQQISARQEMLGLSGEPNKADPAGYVAASPPVATAMQAVNPDDPKTMEDYAQATLQEQARLGVPEAGRHILTRNQAQGLVQSLTSADPATLDAGAALDHMATQYGASWNRAFGDMVTLGKLPHSFQVLAAMSDAGDRAQFQRMLQTAAKRGGSSQLRKDAPDVEVKTIDRDLDDKLADFRASTAQPGLPASVDLLTSVREAIRDYAYYRAIQGRSGDRALDDAAQAVIGHFDFWHQADDAGSVARVPKGQTGQVEAAASAALQALKPEDLAPFKPTGDPRTDETRQTDVMRALRSASWTNNQRGDGLVAYLRLNNGAIVPVMRRDGTQLELKFGAMQPAPPPSATDPSLLTMQP